MVNCSCYHDEVNFIGQRGVCWGTKEKEPCSCGGAEAKCDFYDYVRERAKKPPTNYDSLIQKTPEEMAKWIESIEPAACPSREDHGDDCHFVGTCTECWLDWLKRECEV